MNFSSATFHVGIPNDLLSERRYAVRVVLEAFLGFRTIIEPQDTKDVTLRLCSGPGQIRINDSFFSSARSNWLQPGSFSFYDLAAFRPDRYVHCRLVERELPVLFGRPAESGEWILFNDDGCFIQVDVFGAAFFMLARYEEYVGGSVDEFGRFPAEETLLARTGALDRPLLNEYVELLWSCMSRFWPGLTRAPRSYRVLVSHDVDLPFSITGLPAWRVLHSMAGDLLRRSDPSLLLQRLRAAVARKPQRIVMDPYYQFPYLFSIANRYSLQSSYYLIAGHTVQGGRDGFYSLDDPVIHDLIRSISENGHEIGLHASYNSAECDSVSREFAALQKICDQLGVHQQSWGGRHHYLRISPRSGFAQWSDAGLEYDSSLGYATQGGFRSGTCYEYPTFSLTRSLELPLKERPLIVMDMSLFASIGRGFSFDLACEQVVTFAQRCRQFEGDFTLLWHNSGLQQEWQRRAYETVIAGITS